MSIPTLFGRTLAVGVAQATVRLTRKRHSWKRRLGDVLFGVALGLMLALLAITVMR